MSDPSLPRSRDDDARDGERQLDDLEARLRKARKGTDAKPASRSSHRELGLAYRVMIEMIAGLAFGAGVGWMLDSWLGTRPFVMVVMILLGFAAALRNAWRASQSVTGASALRDEGEPGAR